MKSLRTCAQGHRYYKSSNCPSCPICMQHEKPNDGFLSLLSAPARRAFLHHQVDSLEKLTNYTAKEILAWHGIGKTSLPILEKALQEQQLCFKK